MFVRRRERNKPAESVTNAEQRKELYVHISDGSWKVALVENGEILEHVKQQQAVEAAEEIDDRLVGIFEDLNKSFQSPALKEAGTIRILLDDPEFVAFESRDHQLPSLTTNAVREIGARHLSARAATLGFRPYPGQGVSEEGTTDGVFVLMDVDRLRRNLTLLDTRALRVSAVVPIGDLLLERSFSGPGTGHAVFYLGDFTSYLAISNVSAKVVVLRSMPIGIQTLIHRVASESRVSVEETAKAVAERDFISNLSLWAESGESSIQSSSAQGRAVAPHLRELFRTVRESFEFFETQFVGGKVQSVEFLGELSAIEGLRGVLSREIDLLRSDENEDLLSLFVAGRSPNQMNFLTGADQPLVTVQKISYRYIDDKFVSEQEVARARKEKAEAEARRGRNQTEQRRPRRRGSSRSRKAETSRVSVIQWIRSFGAGRSSISEAEDSPEMEQNERAFFMILGLVVLGLLYAGWAQYDSVARTHSIAVANYYNDIVQNRRYRDKIFSNRSFRSAGSGESDKVLWSEKFLSVASNMSEAMWITDVYLSDQTRKFGENEVVAKKLTIEGAVLPSTDGHIQRISEYIDQLLKDEQYFMSDFREITFDGAKIDQEEADHVIRFAIDAWYDENKRVENKTEVTGEGGSPIGDMQKKVGDRNRDVTNSLSGQVDEN